MRGFWLDLKREERIRSLRNDHFKKKSERKRKRGNTRQEKVKERLVRK